MGSWVSCGSNNKTTRFKVRAEPVLAELRKQRDIFTRDGQQRWKLAETYRSEAIRHYDQGNDFDARLAALEALEHEAMANRYLKIIESNMEAAGQINLLSQQYDVTEDYKATAEQLRKLGLIKEAHDETQTVYDDKGEMLDEKMRMTLAEKSCRDFDQLVKSMNEQIIEIRASKIDSSAILREQTKQWDDQDTPERITHLIQSWKLPSNKRNKPFAPKPPSIKMIREATPANISMLETSAEEEEEKEEHDREECDEQNKQ